MVWIGRMGLSRWARASGPCKSRGKQGVGKPMPSEEVERVSDPKCKKIMRVSSVLVVRARSVRGRGIQIWAPLAATMVEVNDMLSRRSRREKGEASETRLI